MRTTRKNPKPNKKKLRALKKSFTVAPPKAVTIRTRLHPTPSEETLLREVGDLLGKLQREDYKKRAHEGQLDQVQKLVSRRERKRSLSQYCSSRWAGSITGYSEQSYNTGWQALLREKQMLEQATSVIKRRLGIRVGERETLSESVFGKPQRGYASKQERHLKQQRLKTLETRLDRVNQRILSEQPKIVFGGKRLWRNKNNLDKTNMSELGWRKQWEASRRFLSADGETGKRWGNETIRIVLENETQTGFLELKIPKVLEEAYGTRVRLAHSVGFSYRTQEWLDRVSENQAVSYTIREDVSRGRWYLDATWCFPKHDTIPTPEQLGSQKRLAIDLNQDHLAGFVIDPSGNPVGKPLSIPLVLEGLSHSKRDAYVRHAITTLTKHAKSHDCSVIVIEDLDFTDARNMGRETLGRGKRGKQFRKLVAGIPTSQFRNRLVGMCYTQGLWLLAVDPAYTSQWGAQHWYKPLVEQFSDQATTHHAAAVAIGRRSLGKTIQRKPAGVRKRQRTLTIQPRSSRVDDSHDNDIILNIPPPGLESLGSDTG